MATQTGQQMLDRVRFAADIQANTARHTDADLLSAINQSICAYKRMMSRYDSQNYAAGTVITTTSGVATVALPATEEVLAAICSLQNVTTTMHKAGLQEQTQYQITGRPATYRVNDVGTVGSSVLVLYPTPDSAYQIQVQYVASHTDVTSSTTWSPEIRGADDWVVYDVACKVAMRDAHPRFGMLQAERSRQEGLLRDMALRTREPGHRMDTRGQRRVNDLLARRRA